MARRLISTTTHVFKDQLDTLCALSKITNRPVAEIIREGINLVLRKNEQLIRKIDVPFGAVRFTKKDAEIYLCATDLDAVFKHYNYENGEKTIKNLVRTIKREEPV